MAGIFRRWLGGDAASRGWHDVRRWAEAAGHRFALGRGGEGFVVEAQGSSGGAGCRIEWGPSQRNYIAGQELRVRADIGAGDVQMLAATRDLVGRLEREAFEQFTEGNQTRIDDDTPEEMRWVVLFPQVPAKVLGALAVRFALLANRPRAATLWLEEGLAAPLAASASWLARGRPMVLVVQRGRFVLRLGCEEPQCAVLEGAMALGLAAAAAARRVAVEVRRGAVNSQRPSTWGPAPSRAETQDA